MNFELNEDQQLLQETVRKFAADRYDFTARRQNASAGRTDRELWRQFADLGLLGIFVEEGDGGLGWSLTEGAIVLEEFGRALMVEPFIEVALLAVRILASSESAAARALLRGIADGTCMVTACLSEPASRYGYAKPSCQASRWNGGFRLSGQKIVVSGGDVADKLIVSAKLDEGLGLFLVSPDAANVVRRSYQLLDGSWASDVRFAEAALEPNSLLLSGPVAEKVLRRGLDEAALGVAAQEVGCIDRIVELTAEYLRNRKQFGQPLAGFQVLQHRLADLFIESQMARSALHSALSAFDGPELEREAAVSGTRVRIDQAAMKVGNQGIHLHGGIGMTMEYPVGHYFRRLLVLTKAFGDTEHHIERFERLMVPAA